ncbi:MAG: YfhO family protein, partial [Anaerolineae bacterium]|nr:YfhO family protein [Anaerolineae bacterium]
VPGFALFRGQERLALVISFSLAILAGYGLHDLTRALDVRRARRAWALLPAGIVIGLMFVFTLYISGTLRQSGRVAFLGDRAALVTLLFTLATVLVAWRMRLARATPLFVVTSIALMVFDLFSINSQAYNATPQERYPLSPIIQTIRSDEGVFRVVDEGKMPGHFGIVYDVEEIGGISPLKIARYDFLRENLSEEKLWRLLNVRYVITGRAGMQNAELVTNDGDTRLLRLHETMPRAWFVASAIHNPDDAQVLAALASDDFDAWRVVYLADASPHARVTSSHAPTPANFERITPEHARVTLDAPSEGWLVVSANYYYPGWRAFVNGVETRIVRANIALCAVPVRAGTQKIEFVFEPWSVKVGITTSITLILLVLAVVIILSKSSLRQVVVLLSREKKQGENTQGRKL